MPLQTLPSETIRDITDLLALFKKAEAREEAPEAYTGSEWDKSDQRNDAGRRSWEGTKSLRSTCRRLRKICANAFIAKILAQPVPNLQFLRISYSMNWQSLGTLMAIANSDYGRLIEELEVRVFDYNALTAREDSDENFSITAARRNHQPISSLNEREQRLVQYRHWRNSTYFTNIQGFLRDPRSHAFLSSSIQKLPRLHKLTLVRQKWLPVVGNGLSPDPNTSTLSYRSPDQACGDSYRTQDESPGYPSFWEAFSHVLDCIAPKRECCIDTLGLSGLSNELLPVPADCANLMTGILSHIRDLRVYGLADRDETCDRREPDFQRCMVIYTAAWERLLRGAKNLDALTLGLADDNEYGQLVGADRSSRYKQCDVLHALIRSVEFNGLHVFHLRNMVIFADDFEAFLKKNRSTIHYVGMHIVKLASLGVNEDSAHLWQDIFDAIRCLPNIKDCLMILTAGIWPSCVDNRTQLLSQDLRRFLNKVYEHTHPTCLWHVDFGPYVMGRQERGTVVSPWLVSNFLDLGSRPRSLKQ